MDARNVENTITIYPGVGHAFVKSEQQDGRPGKIDHKADGIDDGGNERSACEGWIEIEKSTHEGQDHAEQIGDEYDGKQRACHHCESSISPVEMDRMIIVAD